MHMNRYTPITNFYKSSYLYLTRLMYANVDIHVYHNQHVKIGYLPFSSNLSLHIYNALITFQMSNAFGIIKNKIKL